MVLSNGFFYERIQLDTINERFNKVPTAKEGDANGRGMIVVLTENGLVKNTTGVSLLFKWEHTRIAEAQGLEDFEPLDLTKGEYIVTYPTEMNHEGYVKAEIRIIDNGKYAGSRNMKIQVEPSVGDDTAMESSNQFSALVTALLEVNSWNARIDAVEADFIQRANDVEATYPQELLSLGLQLAEVPVEINKGVATHTINNGGAYLRQPVACITFDDSPMADYTWAKPILDEYGIVGTSYINTSGIDLLTESEILKMYNAGWEFGSHTRSHSILSAMSLSQPIDIGDTVVKVNAPYGFNQVKIDTVPIKFRIADTDYVFTATASVYGNYTMTLTLSAPTTFAVSTPKEIYLHEESVVYEATEPKEYLESIGVPCYGLAYPWGDVTNSGKRVIESNFLYGRSASSLVVGTNGGLSSVEEINLKQFEIKSTEILGRTEAEIDSLIAQVKSEKSMLVLLCHSKGWTTALETTLRMVITKLQAANLPIMTVNEALKYHGNILNYADFNISKNGRMYGADFFLPFNSIFGTDGLSAFPSGLSQVRVTGGIAKGFPTDAGILTTVKSRSGAWWSYQEWMEFDSGLVSGRKYTRISTGWNTWSTWVGIVTKGIKKAFISLGSQTIPANGKVDVEVVDPELVINNYSTPIVIANTLHDYVSFTPFISGGKLYVRLENTSDSPVTWIQQINVTVNNNLT